MKACWHSIAYITASLWLASCNNRAAVKGQITSAEALQKNLQSEAEPTPDATNPPEEPADVTITAVEPVAVGGAFLACSYAEAQPQNSASYQLNCQLKTESPVSLTVIDAQFYKVSGEVRTKLMVSKYSSADLSWELSEPQETVFHQELEASIAFSNGASLMLKSNVTPSLGIKPSIALWLGNEPNNQIIAGTDEDCVEYNNAVAKQSHADFSGFTSGPLGRLNDLNCSTVLNFLCKNTLTDGKAPWIVSASSGPWTNYATACPVGYKFLAPMTNAEYTAINTLMDVRTQIFTVWVPIHDRVTEGSFQIFWVP